MSKAEPKHIYRKLRVDEVSFVDKGASPGARVAFWKRRTQEKKNMDLDAILAKLSEEEKALVLAAIESAKAPVSEVEKAPEEPKEEEKELSDSVKKRLVEADVLRERVAKLEDENMTRVYVEKAASLPFVPGLTRSELGEVLKCVDLGRPIAKALGVKLEKSLRSINEAVSKSAVFGEAGTSASGVGAGEDKIASVAKSMRAQQPSLTYEQAYAKALNEHPELYADYERDNPPARI